jgi:hypothetical protein
MVIPSGPTFARVVSLRQGVLIQCMNNLRQLSVTSLLYADDNTGILFQRLYTAPIAGTDQLWVGEMNVIPKLYQCEHPLIRNTPCSPPSARNGDLQVPSGSTTISLGRTESSARW